MALLRFYLANEVESLVKNGVRLTVIGRRDRLPDGIAAAIARAEAATAGGDVLHLRIAVDYSARDAILMPRRRLAGITEPTRELFSAARHRRGRACATSTSSSAPAARSGCPTSCSGKAPTPNCTSPSGCGPSSMREDLAEALASFHRRERRFGGLNRCRSSRRRAFEADARLAAFPVVRESSTDSRQAT